ncbi:Protein K03H1.13 b [Aphelenchoides avenae]|nr:Protein K03H1.13 b [Aphelenchus avenae]
MTRKWDILALTVGSEKQKYAALKQLEELNLTDLVEAVAVMADYPPGVKIDLYLTYGVNLLQKRVLLLHTGGYSQRLLHASAMGKAFMLMPSGKTFLEIKVRTFQPVLEQMQPGVLICSADTLEYVGNAKFNHNADIILFGHESTLDVASQHGVYSVNDDGQLAFVLQKPSLKEMHERGVVKNERAITDSCYILGATVVRALVELRKARGVADCEICCYGDFLRPLGLSPTKDWLAAEGTPLSAWQRALTDIMKQRNTVVVNLGPDSFYHLGTTAELHEYFFNSPSFIAKFIESSTINILFSMVADPSQVTP